MPRIIDADKAIEWGYIFSSKTRQILQRLWSKDGQGLKRICDWVKQTNFNYLLVLDR